MLFQMSNVRISNVELFGTKWTIVFLATMLGFHMNSKVGIYGERGFTNAAIKSAIGGFHH